MAGNGSLIVLAMAHAPVAEMPPDQAYVTAACMAAQIIIPFLLAAVSWICGRVFG